MSSHVRWSVLVVTGFGCTALTGVDVVYRDCVPVRGSRYAEDFNGTYQELLDRCWKSELVAEGTKTFTADGDLVVRPLRGLGWSETTRAPMVFRGMSGDFLVVTRAEALSTIFQAHHCLTQEESAGLVVRRREPLAWATLLVRPYFDPTIPVLEACKDDSATPPKARAQARSVGFGEAQQREVVNIGRDAEAYIALCRQGDQLGYYYRAETPVPNQTWLLIHRHTISTGNVDVGLTASGAPANGEDSGVEGHFNWVVFEDYGSAPAVDGCEGALKKFVVPVGG